MSRTIVENPWSRRETVEGFVASPPNATLMEFAGRERQRAGGDALALDIGCGAARNAWPLAASGWNVLGIDTSQPMLDAARQRAETATPGSLWLAEGTLDRLPVRDRSFDLIIAHGVWNLAASSREFRGGIAEAARVAKPGAALFLFTFSRSTLPPEAKPMAGEDFVYTQFSGRPQCFLTREEVLHELAEYSFSPDPAVPLRELNRPAGTLRTASSAPVIFEGTFRYSGL